MRALRVADNLTLPAEAVTQTFAILAKRGVGKTYTASVLTEEMLKAGLQVVVADPIGVWWGVWPDLTRGKYARNSPCRRGGAGARYVAAGGRVSGWRRGHLILPPGRFRPGNLWSDQLRRPNGRNRRRTVRRDKNKCAQLGVFTGGL